MKDLFENKKALIILGGGLLAIITVGLLTFSLGGRGSLSGEDESVTTIEAKSASGKDTLTLHSDGRVEIRRGDDIYNDYWAGSKANALFAYYNEIYGNSATVENGKATFTYDDDELIGAIINETTGGGGGSGGNNGGGGQDIGNFFKTATPAPTGSGGSNPGQNTNPTATPASPQGQPWCLYWRLSYCVIAYQTPVPGASATPAPNILPPTCPQNTLTGKTVIGDELCFSSPTPNP